MPSEPSLPQQKIVKRIFHHLLSVYPISAFYWYYMEKYKIKSLCCGLYFWTHRSTSYPDPLVHFLHSIKVPGIRLLEETQEYYVCLVPMYTILEVPEDWLTIIPKTPWEISFPRITPQRLLEVPSQNVNESFKTLVKTIPVIASETNPTLTEFPHMSSRTLLQLRSSYKKNPGLKDKPKAYFWNWLSAHVSDAITKNPIVGPYGVTNLNTLLHNVVPDLMKRFSKIFGEEMVYVGNSFMYGGTKSLIYPKSICKSYVSTVSDEDWILGEDWDKLKDNETIVWDAYNKMWCLQDTRKIVLGQTATGKKYSTITAYTNRVRNETQKCPECGSLWFKQWVTRYEGDLFCPDCILAAKAPNVPHKRESIFQGYHSSTKNGWKYRVQKLGQERSMPMGVELEVQSRPLGNSEREDSAVLRCSTLQQYRSWKIYEHQLELNKDWHNLIFERDGSLGDGGIEIISNPLTLEYGSLFWTKMLPYIAKHCAGWNTEDIVGPTYEYGIHITTHRDFWTDYRIGRLMKFLHNPDNTSFLLVMAQRAAIYGGGDIGKFDQSLKRNITYRTKGKLGGSINRYSLVNVKAQYLEFRMFRSTLNVESFMKNLEFIDGIHRWIHQTPYSDNYMEFIKWVVSTPENHIRYSHLINYLDRPKFNVKKLKVKIMNSWKPLLTNYTKGQKPLFEDLAAPTTDIPEEPSDVPNH